MASYLGRRKFLATRRGVVAARGAGGAGGDARLHSGSLETSAPYLTAFRKGLSETGFVEGRNVAIELLGTRECGSA